MTNPVIDYYYNLYSMNENLLPFEERSIKAYLCTWLGIEAEDLGSYTLPSDFLSLYRFGEYFKSPNYSDNIISSDERYSIEGNKILCDQKDKLYLTYISKVEDPSKFSVSFREALVNKIAAEYAAKLKQSINLANKLDEAFIYYMDQAQQNNELMTDSETMPDGSWIGVRGSWSNEY